MERVSESKLNQSRVIDTRIDAVLKQIQATKEMQGLDLERVQNATRFILEMYENKRMEEEQQTFASKQMIEVDEEQGILEMSLTDDMRAKTSPQQEQPQ